MIRILGPSALISLVIMATPCSAVAGSFDHLTDLTGKVVPIVTLKARDNFTSEYAYDISVRNQSPEIIAADSLVVVLDRITNLAGEDRQSLNNETILSRFEVLGEDGITNDGKPFFRIPASNGPDLPPQTDSRPASVRVRNKDYMAVFTPSFRVYGLARQPERTKQTEAASVVRPPSQPAASAPRQQMEKLIQLLIQKGLLTEEEWRKANQP